MSNLVSHPNNKQQIHDSLPTQSQQSRANQPDIVQLNHWGRNSEDSTSLYAEAWAEALAEASAEPEPDALALALAWALAEASPPAEASALAAAEA